MKNIALAVEVEILLDLIEAVEHNVKGYDDEKIKTCADCRKVWELLTSEKVKASKFAGDGGSMISRIIALERKIKIEVEHAHAKTKTCDDDAIKMKV